MTTYDEALLQSVEYFNGEELPAKVFLDKYALRDKEDTILEITPDDKHRRLAKEFARIEAKKFKNPLSEEYIYELFKNYKYIIPQGSPMYGIGNPYQIVSLSNCYVLETPVDSYNSILDIDKQLVNISKRRGGVGIDLSNLRPKGFNTNNAAKTSTGIVSWMERYSNSIREVGQCLDGECKVITSNGLSNIKDVKPEEMVWTKNGWVRVVKIFKNGKKKLYKLTTSTGYSVISSEDHIYQSFDEDGNLTEQKLQSLSPGDNIVLCLGNGSQTANYVKLQTPDYKNSNNKPSNCVLPEILDEKLAYILGYSYGDGCVYKERILSLACCNDYPKIKTKIEKSTKVVFDYDISYGIGDGDLETLDICNKTVVQFLKHNSLLKQKSGSLIFPEKILQSPISVQCAFISGYLDADGDACSVKSGYRIRSVDRSMLEYVQLILSSIGIASKISEEDRSKQNWKTLYSLSVVGAVNQKRFVEFFQESIKVSNTGFVSKRECWLTPFKSKSFGIKYNNFSYCPDNSSYLSLQTITKLENEEQNVITTLLQDTIQDISEVKHDETYDLQLEEEHLFWCNGIYLHNSGRRGALMLTISVHHPDIIDFITIKNDDSKVTGANISVRLTDEFLDAVKKNEEYEIRFPIENPTYTKKISAKEVWQTIIHSAWLRAEPGLLMWSNVLKGPAEYYVPSSSTNPCSELPLPSYDSCRLLVLNLLSFVVDPYTDKARFDYGKFYEYSQIAQRLMDDLVDLESEAISRIINKIYSDPEPIEIKQKELDLWYKIKDTNDQYRRTGTGITALGDTLAALGIKYGSEDSIWETGRIYEVLKFGCYRSSVDMAKELGAFKGWSPDIDKTCTFLTRIHQDIVDWQVDDRIESIIGWYIYDDMQKYGRRNIALTTTAPTGTVSILTQTTSGIEPLFRIEPYTRRKKVNPGDKHAKIDFVDKSGDSWQEFEVCHPQLKKWMEVTGEKDWKKSPWYGACAEDIDWIQRVKLQAAAQEHVCHAISSTINLPENVSEETVSKIYQTAFESGLKGITIYRNNCRTGVLVDKKETTSNERPKTIDCDVYHVSAKGQSYFVLVGLLNDKPYEVFAGKNGFIPKAIKSGKIIKKSAGYKVEFDDSDLELSPITASMDEMEEVVSRFTSGLLRLGGDMHFIVKQLEKVGERQTDLNSFSRSVARVLKKYIPDGTKEGEKCPECSGELIRQEGCKRCMNPECGFSACM